MITPKMQNTESGRMVMTPYAPSGLAGLVAAILRWLTPETTIALAAPAEIPSPPAVEKKLVPPDNGRMTSKEIADAAARLLWAHRGALTVATDYREDESETSLHSGYVPTVTVTLPGGLSLIFRTSHDTKFPMSVRTPDGQERSIWRSDALQALVTWQAVQTDILVDVMGLHDIIEPDPCDDGGTPSEMAGQRLAKALGRHVERRAPTRHPATQTRTRTIDGRERTWEEPSPWQELGEGVMMTGHEMHESSITALRGRPETERGKMVLMMRLSHSAIGEMVVMGAEIERGLRMLCDASMRDALGMAHELPRHLPMPRGNAKAARILRICREAVAAEPDLVDACGVPVAPLVDRHLPELMRRHAEASRNAPADQLDAIDDELAQGIDIVRRTVEEALAVSAVAKRDALRTELRFLEMRHPEPVPALSCLGH